MPKFQQLIILLGLTVLLSACSVSLAGDITPPPGAETQPAQPSTQSVTASPIYPIVPPDLAAGAVLYSHNCAECHGTRGMGDGPQAAQLSVPVAALGLADFARGYTPEAWFSVVSRGNMEKFMPAFPNLTDRQRWDVVAYAISLSMPAEVIAQGEQIYQASCLTCHGEKGRGDGADAVTLSTRPIDFTDQAIMAERSGANLYQAISVGVSPDMPAYSSTLDEKERWALVSYLRSLTFSPSAAAAQAYPAPQGTAYPAPGSYPAPAQTQVSAPAATAVISPTATFTGTVSVELVNGSGGEPLSNLPVILYGFDNMQNTYSETLTTGVSGVYTFTNVLMPQGRVFLASTEYHSGTYGSDIVTVDPNVPHQNLQITVYDSTSDISALTTDRVHIFFDFSNPQKAQVIEVFIISNPSQKAIVPPTPDGSVVTFPLPDGYSNLQFQDGALGGRYVQVAQGFADRLTVNPGVGAYQVIFAFNMDYNRKLDFSQLMFLPTNAVVVMIPDVGINLQSAQLQDGGTRDFQGTAYHMYNASSLLAGTPLEFNLSGKAKKAGGSVLSAGSTQAMAIGLGAFGVALVLGGLWLYRRNQLKLASQPAAADAALVVTESGEASAPEDEDTLMDAIIALDDQYRDGNIPEEAYLERRAALKARLNNSNPGENGDA